MKARMCKNCNATLPVGSNVCEFCGTDHTPVGSQMKKALSTKGSGGDSLLLLLLIANAAIMVLSFPLCVIGAVDPRVTAFILLHTFVAHGLGFLGMAVASKFFRSILGLLAFLVLTIPVQIFLVGSAQFIPITGGLAYLGIVWTFWARMSYSIDKEKKKEADNQAAEATEAFPAATD